MENIFLLCTFLVFVYMSLLYVAALINKRNDIADIGWGIGFIIVAVVSVFYGWIINGPIDLRSVFLALLVFVWGIRLATHIYIRNKNKTEDPRYVKWRMDWGKWFYLRSYLQVFLLQGLLLLLISIPVMLVSKHTGKLFPTVLDIVGLGVWVIGFLYESVGDKQLATFLKDPANKGKIMKSGLWSLTRHPNYFGEVTMWWGVWLISLSAGVPWWSIVGPLTITYLITKVSGIPMTEARYKGNTEFDEYKKITSSLIPLYPGKKIFSTFRKSRV